MRLCPSLEAMKMYLFPFVSYIRDTVSFTSCRRCNSKEVCPYPLKQTHCCTQRTQTTEELKSTNSFFNERWGGLVRQKCKQKISRVFFCFYRIHLYCCRCRCCCYYVVVNNISFSIFFRQESFQTFDLGDFLFMLIF